MTALKKKLPPLDEILGLYATIVFLIYGWASITFSWKVPSWLYFLSLGEIGAILSYTLVSSLLECTIILFIFLLVGLILPAKLFINKFIVRGSLIFYILTFWVILFHLSTLIQLPTRDDLVTFGLLAFLTLALGLVIAERIPAVQRMLVALGNRLTVFLYLWLPLSIVGILILLVRIA